MFNTNGYREFQLTQIARISIARKAIAKYQKALDTGFSFAGEVVTPAHREALTRLIAGQREVIAEVAAMQFHPGEW